MDFSAKHSLIFSTESTEKKHFNSVTDSGFSSLADVDNVYKLEPDSSIDAEECDISLNSDSSKEVFFSKQQILVENKLTITSPRTNNLSTTKPTLVDNELNSENAVTCEISHTKSNDLIKSPELLAGTNNSKPCKQIAKYNKIQQRRSVADDYTTQQNIKRLLRNWRNLKNKTDNSNKGFLAVKSEVKKYVNLQIKVNTISKDNLVMEKQLGLISEEFDEMESTIDSLLQEIHSFNYNR